MEPGLIKPKVTLSGLPRLIADDIEAAETTLARLAAFKQAGGRVGLAMILIAIRSMPVEAGMAVLAAFVRARWLAAILAHA